MDINKAVRSECLKLIRRQQLSAVEQHIQSEVTARKTGQKRKVTPPVPKYWSASPIFNPFATRKQLPFIARAITSSLEAGRYSPRPAIVVTHDKPGGGGRPISISPVADAAVAAACFRHILRRNQHRLSPHSYAYRRDIGVHEAIETLRREARVRHRFVTVEFDFSKYFDTISHDYLRSVIGRYFKIGRQERQIVDAFLNSSRAFGFNAYRSGRFERYERGIPQGNSISLFLANLACHELDLELARGPSVFLRYADDILILSPDESAADRATESILAHCDRAGLTVNFDKSPGCQRLGPEAASRFQLYYEDGPRRPDLSDASSARLQKSSLDYLGHRLQYRRVQRRGMPASEIVRRMSIRPRSQRRIQTKVRDVIYRHLLKWPRRGQFSRKRVDVVRCIDWDVVTCINDLRAYLYGGLSEDNVREGLARRETQLYLTRSALAFFPLVDDVRQLKALDSWLVYRLAPNLAPDGTKLLEFT